MVQLRKHRSLPNYLVVTSYHWNVRNVEWQNNVTSCTNCSYFISIFIPLDVDNVGDSFYLFILFLPLFHWMSIIEFSYVNPDQKFMSLLTGQKMKVYIRKDHILSRHFDNMEDDSAGIFYGEEGSGLA